MNGGAHVISEQAAAAALRRRRRWQGRGATTLRHVATATTTGTTTEVGFPPDFFPSTNRFLRFPSNLQNGCMKIVLGFFLLFIEIFVSVVGSRVCIDFVKWFSFVVHGCASILLFESLFWRMPFWFCWFSFLVHGCDFFASNDYIFEGRIGFFTL